MWYEIIFPVIIGIIGMLFGIKLGFQCLAQDLFEQMKLRPEEYKYITSSKYFWKCFNPFNNDRQ